MATRIPMTRNATGEVRNAYRGISWTGLFFGPFVPLFRGHILGAIVWIIVLPTLLGHLIMMLVYNGWHQNWLIGKGYGIGGQIGFGASNTITIVNNVAK